ncbi:MAG: NUDIX hydrolase [Halobacteriales archaeon]
MSRRDVRPVALGVATREDELLLVRFDDPETGETYARPPGGGIEFGEGSVAALAREFREELDASVETDRLIGVIENRFSLGGERGHEVVFVHAVEFADDTYYGADRLQVAEGDGETHEARWGSLDAIEARLVPDGLGALLIEADPDVEGVHAVAGEPPFPPG